MSSMRSVPVSGAHLACYSEGAGPAVIFLHGGPGDTHHYMKRMAEPLFEDFQCIFFDQRGTGDSQAERVPENFKLDLLFEDLLAIKKSYELDELTLVGHSWGAMYALFAYPRCDGRRCTADEIKSEVLGVQPRSTGSIFR